MTLGLPATLPCMAKLVARTRPMVYRTCLYGVNLTNNPVWDKRTIWPGSPYCEYRSFVPNMGDYRTKDAMTPLAMGILAALSPGHDITFYDERLEELPQTLPNADLIAISVETFTARRSYLLADHYRKQGKKVVMGGYHVTFMPEEALQHADSIVIGDAEGVWEQMLLDVENETLKESYVGSRARSLDNYPLDRSIFAGKRYAPLELIQYSRGCRFACDFCSIHAFYPDGVRTRPVGQLKKKLSAYLQGVF